MNSFPPAVLDAFFIVFVLLALWSLVWKGIALWHSARNHQKVWFVVLLVVHTVGILDILYILFFRKNKNSVVRTTTTTHTTTASTPMPEATVPSPLPPPVV